MKMKKLLVKQYLSEINWENTLEPGTENLIIAPTSSGKTVCFIKELSMKKNIAITSPFVSLNQQFIELNPVLQTQVGLKPKAGNILPNNGVITSFHSIPRLLEIQDPLDFLIVDEIHYMVSYAGFSGQMLNPFWETIELLKEKHPKMIIVYLTATPQFIMSFARHQNWNVFSVEPLKYGAKPSEVIISTSLAPRLKKKETALILYPSKKQGMKWAKKYNGAFISSEVKDTSKEFQELVMGNMPNEKVFTSTILSTGLSIHDPVDTVYTSWAGSLIDIIQMSARPRQGGHLFFIQQITNPWFQEYMDLGKKPEVRFDSDYQTIFEDLSNLSQWTSVMAHKCPILLEEVVQKMLYNPEYEIEIPQEMIDEFASGMIYF